MFVTNMEDVTHRNNIAMCCHIPKMQVKTTNSILGSPWPRRVIIYLGRWTRAGTQNETKPLTLAFFSGCLSETDLPDFA